MTVEIVTCERCGQPADADRIDISTVSHPAMFVWGRIVCTTRGCVDSTGSAAVDPPYIPGHLTREDWAWVRHHQRLAEEYGRVERALREVG